MSFRVGQIQPTFGEHRRGASTAPSRQEGDESESKEKDGTSYGTKEEIERLIKQHQVFFI
jgi:hypothetical protein